MIRPVDLGDLDDDDDDMPTPRHDKIVIWLDDHAEEIVRSVLEVPEGAEFETEWEMPLIEVSGEGKYRRQFTVGFVDLAVRWSWADLCEDQDCRKIHRHVRSHAEALFEVKPEIASLGTLLRQLQRYKSSKAARNRKIIVVSPDTQHAERIRKQGFGFVDPEEW